MHCLKILNLKNISTFLIKKYVQLLHEYSLIKITKYYKPQSNLVDKKSMILEYINFASMDALFLD